MTGAKKMPNWLTDRQVTIGSAYKQIAKRHRTSPAPRFGRLTCLYARVRNKRQSLIDLFEVKVGPRCQLGPRAAAEGNQPIGQGRL